MKKLLLLLLCVPLIVSGQVQQLDAIIQDDASNFLEVYFSPLGQSFGAGLNNGWYNTAKPHKLGGFDVTLTLNAVHVPSTMLVFDPNDIDNFSSNSTTPTILGAGDGSEITYTNNGNSITFDMPHQGSLKKSLIPVPMINAGLGLVKKTEIDVRYLPTYDFDMGFGGAGSVGLWGIGIKHDLLQWIPVAGDAIPISLSIQAGHTKFNTSFSIENPDPDPLSSVNQDISMDVNATTVNLILSKKLLMLTAYAGIGYNSSVTTFNAETESFYFGVDGSSIQMNIPLEMKFESQNEMRTNIGLRLNLAVIAIQANHTFSKYPVTTVGVGISVR
ncbi:MAG: hypothetical protein HOC66_03555 [Flavobacteriales bacterium]|nr:hypothetical protein [Flavobacteriales bacterium]